MCGHAVSLEGATEHYLSCCGATLLQAQHVWTCSMPGGCHRTLYVLLWRYLASGSTFVDMQYAWRVPQNTICLAVAPPCFRLNLCGHAVCLECATEHYLSCCGATLLQAQHSWTCSMPGGCHRTLYVLLWRHLASGSTCVDMQYAWRVPQNTICLAVAPPCFRLNIRGHALCLEGATEHYLYCCGATLLQAQHSWTCSMPGGCHRTLSVLLWRHLASGSTFVDMQYAWRVPQNTICLAVAPSCFRLNIRGHEVCLEGATEHYLSCCGAILFQAQPVWTCSMPGGCHRTLSVLLWRHLASGSTCVDLQYAWRVQQNTICLAVAPPCFRLNMCGLAVCLEGATEHYRSCCGATLLQAQHSWTCSMPGWCHITLSVLLWRHLASGSTCVDMQYAWRVPPLYVLLWRHLASGSTCVDMQYAWRVQQNTICLAVAPSCFRLNMCGLAVCLEGATEHYLSCCGVTLLQAQPVWTCSMPGGCHRTLSVLLWRHLASGSTCVDMQYAWRVPQNTICLAVAPPCFRLNMCGHAVCLEGALEHYMSCCGATLLQAQHVWTCIMPGGCHRTLSVLLWRHLASGSTFVDMQYAWRVPQNTICLAVAPPCFRLNMCGHAVCLEGATEHYLSCCGATLLQAQHVWTCSMPGVCHRTLSVLLWRHLASGSTCVDLQYAWRVPQNTICLAVAPPCFRLNMCGLAVCLEGATEHYLSCCGATLLQALHVWTCSPLMLSLKQDGATARHIVFCGTLQAYCMSTHVEPEARWRHSKTDIVLWHHPGILHVHTC